MNAGVPLEHEKAGRPAAQLRLLAFSGIPLVTERHDIASLILDAFAACGESLRDSDVLVIARKIASKAEGRVVKLATVTPCPAAKIMRELRRAPTATEVARLYKGVTHGLVIDELDRNQSATIEATGCTHALPPPS